MATKSKADRIQEADVRMGMFLGNANEASERGETIRAERLYAKSQFWLDRYNKLTGNS